MDFPVSNRPAGSQGYVLPGRADSAPYREAVTTELPARQTVTANAQPDGQRALQEKASDDDRRARLLRLADDIRANMQKRYDKDQSTGDLVYRAIDMSSGDVVYQYPNEHAIRLEALLKEMKARQDQSDKKTPLKAGTFVQRSA